MSLATVVLALRGAAAVMVLTTVVGGLPRIVQLGLAVTLGLWAALLAPAGAVAAGPLLVAAAHELVVGATLGILAALPLIAARTAGLLVDATLPARGGPYAALFGVLAAAVFVGIDGHVRFVGVVASSFGTSPGEPLAALRALVPAAVALAIPWLVTAAVVQIAVGAGQRVAGRAAVHAPAQAAVPAALAMMTAALIATLAIAIARLVTG